MNGLAVLYPRLAALLRWLLLMAVSAAAVVVMATAMRPTLDPSHGWTPIRFFIGGKEFRGGFRKCEQPCPDRVDEDYP